MKKIEIYDKAKCLLLETLEKDEVTEVWSRKIKEEIVGILSQLEVYNFIYSNSSKKDNLIFFE